EFTIVGRTGGGKSTLSNVLTESEDFKEMGAQLASQISREKGFELNGKSYNVNKNEREADEKQSRNENKIIAEIVNHNLPPNLQITDEGDDDTVNNNKKQEKDQEN
ncbi:14799_t:CDS:2, partial [Rhizophagus irregularis]